MENLLKNLEILRERVLKTWQLLDIDRKEAQAVEMRQEMNIPGFWDDQKKAVKISQETGLPVKRHIQELYGLIITKGGQFSKKQIVKYVDSKNIYPLSLEDILADDWQVEGKSFHMTITVKNNKENK